MTDADPTDTRSRAAGIRTTQRAVAVLVLAPLLAVACGADDERASTATRIVEEQDLTADGAATSSTERPNDNDDDTDEDDGDATQAGAPTEDPRCTPGPGYTVTEIDDVEIDEVYSEATVVEDEEVGGIRIPGFEVDEVLIPAQTIDGGCIVEYDAPGGCLGAVLITGIEIPEVVIAAATIPGVDAGPFQLASETTERESAGPERAADESAEQECRPEPNGRVLQQVVRQQVVRQQVVRQQVVRQQVVRQQVCEIQGRCTPQILVDQVLAPQVLAPQVLAPQEILEQVILPEVTSPDVGVLADDEATSYTAPGDVLFDFDQATLRPDATVALTQIAASVNERFPTGPVAVEGHTDAVGDDAYNQDLSERRAQAVADWLVANAGIDPARIAVAGFGETAPVAPNTTPDGADDPAGRQENRRVVITARS